MGQTARLALPWPDGNDPASGPAAFEALAESLDPLTPDANQQAALAGTSGAVGVNNKFVTDNDARNANQRVPTDGSVTDAKVAGGANISRGKIQGTPPADNDARLSDARVPLAHAASHQEGGADDIGAPPIGTVTAYAGQLLPAGGKWDWADGGLIDRATFGTFFGRVGHAYNGGLDPGSNKVRKPDKRGRASVGADNFGAGAAGRLPNSPRVIGQNGGVDTVTLAASQIPAHAHPVGDPGHTHNGYCADQMDPPDGSTGKTGYAGGRFAGQWITTNGSNISVSNNTGGGGSHNNMPPYEADNYIVRIA